MGKYTGPLVIINFEGYYDPLLQLLDNMQRESFHRPLHRQMWSVANNLSELEEVLENAPDWSSDAIALAAVDDLKK